MAKKKDAIPLFELMSRARGAPAPARSEKLSPSSQALSTPPQIQDAQDTTPSEVVESPPFEETSVLSALEADAMTEPMVDMSSGRLRLSLNYVSATVILCSLIVLLAGAFVIGRLSAPDSQSPIRAGGAGLVRQEGKKYLVVKWLKGDTASTAAEAKNIEKFCRDKGVFVSNVKLKKSDGMWTCVLSLTYVEPDSSESIDYVDLVRVLGRMYYADANRAGANKGFVPLTNDDHRPWFIEARDL